MVGLLCASAENFKVFEWQVEPEAARTIPIRNDGRFCEPLSILDAHIGYTLVGPKETLLDRSKARTSYTSVASSNGTSNSCAVVVAVETRLNCALHVRLSPRKVLGGDCRGVRTAKLLFLQAPNFVSDGHIHGEGAHERLWSARFPADKSAGDQCSGEYPRLRDVGAIW